MPTNTKSRKSSKTRSPRKAPEFLKVRRDREKNQWAVLDENNNPINYFEGGILRDVDFSTFRVTDPRARGCGAFGRKSVGIAKGRLIKNTRLPLSRIRHFSFNDQGFCDLNGVPLQRATYVYLGAKGNAFYVE